MREMLTSAPGALVKETNIEILYWEVWKSCIFHFLKVKKFVDFNLSFLLLTFLTISPQALVSMTQST